jgi:hypothetical protein
LFVQGETKEGGKKRKAGEECVISRLKKGYLLGIRRKELGRKGRKGGRVGVWEVGWRKVICLGSGEEGWRKGGKGGRGS